MHPVQNRLAILFLFTVLGWHLNVCSEFLLEFSGCCLLFSYQSSLFLSQRQLIYNIISISLCQQFFYFCFKSRCHHRSLEGGCPDDKWYLTTSGQNCQCCFYYFFNSEYSDNFFRLYVWWYFFEVTNKFTGISSLDFFLIICTGALQSLSPEWW